MKHIVTKCAEETKARDKYKSVEAGDAVIADEKLEALVRELLAFRHKMDEDELRASQMKAVIMSAMKERDTLKSKSGVKLATWTISSRKKTNYAAIFKKYNVKQSDIDANTKYETSRVFEIDPDEVMDE